MRLAQISFLIISLLLPIAGAAKEPVVVELFTSQGCSSCPSADAFVRALAVEDSSVIVLGWHVDYWDYMGWKDIFSSPESTARQTGYSRRWNLRSLYTPQIVIQGETQTIGSDAKEVRMYVGDFQAEMPMLSFALSEKNNIARARITPLTKGLPASQIVLVRITPEVETRVERGENAGKTLAEINIVREATVLAEWDGKAPITLDGLHLDTGRYVLLVQGKDFGPILGARFVN